MANDRYRPGGRGFVPEAQAYQYPQQQPEGRPERRSAITAGVKQPASSVASRTAEVNVNGSTTPVDKKFLSKTVGECYSVTVMFSGVTVPCLLDPGSQVTTVGESFFNAHLAPNGFRLRPIPELFTLVSANGANMPYIGYFETDIHAIGQTIRSRVVLVLREKSPVPQANEGVHGILGMNVLQQCWEDLLSSSHKPHLTKIPWPTQDPIWQRALKTTGKTLEFGAKDGKVGKAYLGGQSVVLSARQVAIVKAEGHQGPGGNAYEAVLEPTASRGTPMGVAIPSCLVKVESGSFSLTL